LLESFGGGGVMASHPLIKSMVVEGGLIRVMAHWPIINYILYIGYGGGGVGGP